MSIRETRAQIDKFTKSYDRLVLRIDALTIERDRLRTVAEAAREVTSRLAVTQNERGEIVGAQLSPELPYWLNRLRAALAPDARKEAGEADAPADWQTALAAYGAAEEADRD